MAYSPDAPSVYSGKQVIINSDRLLFNAKNDSILIIIDQSIGMSTNGTFNVDTGEETPVGPSGPPINAADYSSIKSRLKTFLSPQNYTL